MSSYYLLKNVLLFSCLTSVAGSFCSPGENKAGDSQPKNSANTAVKDDDLKDYQWKLLLPINATKPQPNRLNLSVEIPKNFRSLYSPAEMMAHPELLEFIPKTDKDPFSWSEIITIQLFKGKLLDAHFLAQRVKQQLTQLGAPAKVHKEDHKKHGDYAESHFLMTYKNKGRTEILYAHYYSGPFDSSGFQYALELTNSMTEEKAKAKIQEFVKNNIHFIRF